MTVATVEIVKDIRRDSYGLIFGINIFFALGCQVAIWLTSKKLEKVVNYLTIFISVNSHLHCQQLLEDQPKNPIHYLQCLVHTPNYWICFSNHKKNHQRLSKKIMKSQMLYVFTTDTDIKKGKNVIIVVFFN